MGLYYYGARYYDSQLGRFVSPDTVIPQQQGTQAWDRYAYVNNSPVRFIDPSGRTVDCVRLDTSCRDEANIARGEAIRVITGLIARGLYDAAITETIKRYDLDTSYIKGVPRFNASIPEAEGEYLPDGTVEIGLAAFSSPALLASTIYHENIHGEQLYEGRYYLSNLGNHMNEYKAYDREYNQYRFGNRLGLSTADVLDILGRRDYHYDHLGSYQSYADQENYTIPDAPILSPINNAAI